MTEARKKELRRLFISDDPPLASASERVYLIAKLYRSYFPRMPKGKRNAGYLCSGVYELADGHLEPIEEFQTLYEAQSAFKEFAQVGKWKVAFDLAELEELLTGK